jgi:hypothetical protein
MHLSDFIDYSIPELKDQMPGNKKGMYIPQSLHTPLSRKLDLFSELIDLIAPDYSFITLDQWAKRIRSDK